MAGKKILEIIVLILLLPVLAVGYVTETVWINGGLDEV